MKINFKFLPIVFFLTLLSVSLYADDISKRGSVGLQLGGLVKFPDAGTFGATVSEVLPNGPAANAGIKARDVIISLNGEYFKNESDFKKLSLVTAGIPIKFGLVRDSQVISVQLTPLAQQAFQEQQQPKVGELIASDSSNVSQDPVYSVAEQQNGNTASEDNEQKRIARLQILADQDERDLQLKKVEEDAEALNRQNAGTNWSLLIAIFLTLFFGGAPWLLPWVDKKKKKGSDSKTISQEKPPETNRF